MDWCAESQIDILQWNIQNGHLWHLLRYLVKVWSRMRHAVWFHRMFDNTIKRTVWHATCPMLTILFRRLCLCVCVCARCAYETGLFICSLFGLHLIQYPIYGISLVDFLWCQIIALCIWFHVNTAQCCMLVSLILWSSSSSSSDSCLVVHIRIMRCEKHGFTSIKSWLGGRSKTHAIQANRQPTHIVCNTSA